MSTNLTPLQVSQQESSTLREGYVHRVLVAFDDFWNVVGDGLPDQTISSRAQIDATTKHALAAKVLVWALDKLQPQHGEKAEAGDLERAKVVEQVEQATLTQQEQTQQEKAT